ncbi:hypothetical protein [Solirhodobacter olei]|uniref:hypothetical protein n=1 Tax=Solirhodobacter olei TaxID=2493082 RepID=UPI000FD9D96B|nr:hypothetical protein [Solirhodobacter olei]
MIFEHEYMGLCQEKTPGGKLRWRVRVEGNKAKRITIPVGPEHVDFTEYYEAARRGEKLKLEKKSTVKQSRGTLDELRQFYCAAMNKMVTKGNMSELTRSGRERGLRQACDVKKGRHRMGELKADLPKDAFEHIIDSFGSKTGAAETCLKALKAAYKWGAIKGFRGFETVSAIRSPHKGRGGATPWAEADERKFLDRHGSGTMARRWFWLAKNMAGRIGDTHLIGPDNVQLEHGRALLAWQPGKKGSKPVAVPVMQELADELALGFVHPEAFLVTEYGIPFASSGGLDNKIRQWVIDAGLCVEIRDQNGKNRKKATRSQHGLRKRVAKEIAHAGGTVYEIMARLSHSDVKSSLPYTAEVDREALAKSGFDRVLSASFSDGGVPRTKNRGTPVGVGPSKTTISWKTWQPVGESNPSF